MTWLTLQHFCLMFLACHSHEAEVPTPTRWPSTLVLIRAEWQSSSWVSGTWQRWMRRHRSLPTCPSKTQQLSTIRSTSLLLSTNRALLIVEPHGQTLEKLNKTCISLGSKPLVGPMCMMDQLFLPALWSPGSRTSTLLELIGSMLQLKRLFLLSSCFIMFHPLSRSWYTASQFFWGDGFIMHLYAFLVGQAQQYDIYCWALDSAVDTAGARQNIMQQSYVVTDVGPSTASPAGGWKFLTAQSMDLFVMHDLYKEHKKPVIHLLYSTSISTYESMSSCFVHWIWLWILLLVWLQARQRGFGSWTAHLQAWSSSMLRPAW